MLHEPFCNMQDHGETDAGGQTFDSPGPLLAWLHDQAHRRNVFLKDTMDHQHDEVLADRRFLAQTRHAFLIRRPEEIAASYYALFPPMTINAIGMERLCQMQAAIAAAGGTPPVVIDSDDLVTRPAATMAAYCAAVGPALLRTAPRAADGRLALGTNSRLLTSHTTPASADMSIRQIALTAARYGSQSHPPPSALTRRAD